MKAKVTIEAPGESKLEFEVDLDCWMMHRHIGRVPNGPYWKLRPHGRTLVFAENAGILVAIRNLLTQMDEQS